MWLGVPKGFLNKNIAILMNYSYIIKVNRKIKFN